MVPGQRLTWTSRGFMTVSTCPWVGTTTTSLWHSSSVCRALVLMVKLTSPAKKGELLYSPTAQSESDRSSGPPGVGTYRKERVMEGGILRVLEGEEERKRGHGKGVLERQQGRGEMPGGEEKDK